MEIMRQRLRLACGGHPNVATGLPPPRLFVLAGFVNRRPRLFVLAGFVNRRPRLFCVGRFYKPASAFVLCRPVL
jgi:hypothetical protein